MAKRWLFTNNPWYSSKFIHSKVQAFHEIVLSLIHNFAANEPNSDFVISGKQSCVSQILKVVGLLGEKFKFFIPLGIKIEEDLNYINTKLSSSLWELKNDTWMTKISHMVEKQQQLENLLNRIYNRTTV